MPTNDKFNLDGFKVDENDVCTAEGGFAGTLDGGISRTGGDGVTIESVNGNISIQTSGTGYISLLSSGGITMLGLPTSDPNIIGELWSNSGVLTVSAG